MGDQEKRIVEPVNRRCSSLSPVLSSFFLAANLLPAVYHFHRIWHGSLVILFCQILKDTAMNPRELSFQQLFFFHFLYVLLEDLGFSTCHSLYRFGHPFLPL